MGPPGRSILRAPRRCHPPSPRASTAGAGPDRGHPVVGGRLADRRAALRGELGERERGVAEAQPRDLLQAERQRLDVERADRAELLPGGPDRAADVRLVRVREPVRIRPRRRGRAGRRSRPGSSRTRPRASGARARRGRRRRGRRSPRGGRRRRACSRAARGAIRPAPRASRCRAARRAGRRSGSRTAPRRASAAARAARPGSRARPPRAAPRPRAGRRRRGAGSGWRGRTRAAGRCGSPRGCRARAGGGTRGARHGRSRGRGGRRAPPGRAGARPPRRGRAPRARRVGNSRAGGRSPPARRGGPPRGSEDDALQREQPPLVRDAERAERADAAGRHHPVAGDERREPVAGAEAAGGAGRAGMPGERGELAVGDDLAAPDGPEGPRAVAVEAVVELELDVDEVVRGAGEERRQAARQGVLGRRAAERRRRGERRPEHAVAVEPELSDAEGRRLVPHDRRPHRGMLYRRAPMRAYLPALGYVYVGLALVGFALAGDHLRAAEAFFALAGFAYLWFLGSLRARLIRYDPDGFFASVVVLGGASYLPLQASALATKDVELAALGSPGGAVVVVGSSLAAMHARKVPRWFGGLGVVGGLGVLGVGAGEAAAHWTLAGSALWASVLGFMVWVLTASTWMLANR